MPDILTQEEIDAANITAAAEAPPLAPSVVPPEEPPEQPRAPDGKFAPKEPATEEQQEPPAEGQQPQGTVPQQALHAEREKRKGIEKQLNDAKAQLDAIAQMRSQLANRQPEPPKPLEGDESGVEHLKTRLAQLEAASDQTQRTIQTQQLDQAETGYLQSTMIAAEQEYRQQKPDYDAAINHVVQSRAQELAMYGLNPYQIQEAIRGEVADIARSAIEQGKNPAEVGYQLATLRGYRPTEGGEAQPAPTGAAQRQVAGIATAQAGGKSLGQASGAGGVQALNAQSVAAMTNDEFEALYSTPAGRAMIDALG